MEAFLVSTGIVALAEMGDKTQLLSLVLAARFRKPWPIVLGILVATLANHGLAGAVGSWVTTVMGPDVLRWVLGASFIAMAAWMLIPDKLDDDEGDSAPRMGVFLTTVVAFFLAEMGDKTQIATVMLAAQYNAWFAVVAGANLTFSQYWHGATRAPLAIATGAFALFFDYLMEPFAYAIRGYWIWEGNVVPPQNYFSWFIFSAMMAWITPIHAEPSGKPDARPAITLAIMLGLFLAARISHGI